MYGKYAGPALLICGLFILTSAWAGQEAQAIPVLPPLLLPHQQTVTVDNFTGADMQNLSIIPSGAARLGYGEKVWGGEFKVNPDGANQYENSLAAGLDGRYLVAWEQGTGSPNYDIYGQVFERGGTRIGGEIAICTAPKDQWDPDVASDGKGNFLVAWEDRRGPDNHIYASRFDRDGKKIGSEFSVSTGQSSKSNVAVVGRPDGSFVLAWTDTRDGNMRIYARLLDNEGAPLTAEFAASAGVSVQDNADIAVDRQGRFVVVWYFQDGNDYGIVGQRFDSGGGKAGTALTISAGKFDQFWPSVVIDSKNNIVAVWADARDYITNIYDVYTARYDWNGNALGATTKVVAEPKAQTTPAVSIDSRDNVLICWYDGQQSTGRMGYRLYGPQGGPVGDIQYLSSPWYSYFYFSLAVDREDNFMAAWASSTQSASFVVAAPLLQTFAGQGRLATQVFSPPNLVRWGTMSSRMTLGNPSSNSLGFELSTDGGATWTAVPDNGSLAAAGGNPLKLRALLSTSDNLTTPVLNNITLSYTWNTPPSVTAPSVQTVKKGREVTLTANGTDPDLDDAASLTYRWNQTSGKPLGLAIVTGKSLTFKPSSAGKLTFTVVSSDAFASSPPATVSLTVSEERKADQGLPILPIVGAVVIVAVVIGILGAMMMRRKPTTVIQYQPPQQAPAPAQPPAGQYQPAPLGSATPMPQGNLGSATPMLQGAVGSATPMPQGIPPPSSATPVPQVTPPASPAPVPPYPQHPPGQ